MVGIGDKNTCAVGSANGELATKILDEYARGFSERNPNFYVFNSVMHLGEKMPHLHIDYVPVANGSLLYDPNLKIGSLTPKQERLASHTQLHRYTL